MILVVNGNDLTFPRDGVYEMGLRLQLLVGFITVFREAEDDGVRLDGGIGGGLGVHDCDSLTENHPFRNPVK